MRPRPSRRLCLSRLSRAGNANPAAGVQLRTVPIAGGRVANFYGEAGRDRNDLAGALVSADPWWVILAERVPLLRPRFAFVYVREASGPRSEWRDDDHAIAFCCCEDLARNLAQAEIDQPIRAAIVQLRETPRMAGTLAHPRRLSPFDHACTPARGDIAARLVWERDGRA